MSIKWNTNMKTCTLLKFKTPFHLSLFNLIFIEYKIKHTHHFNFMAISPITNKMFEYEQKIYYINKLISMREKKSKLWLHKLESLILFKLLFYIFKKNYQRDLCEILVDGFLQKVLWSWLNITRQRNDSDIVKCITTSSKLQNCVPY